MSRPSLDRDAYEAKAYLEDFFDILWLLFRWCDGRPRLHPVTGQPWRCACRMSMRDACYRERYPRPFDEDEPVYGDHDYETCECPCHDWQDEEEAA